MCVHVYVCVSICVCHAFVFLRFCVCVCVCVPGCVLSPKGYGPNRLCVCVCACRLERGEAWSWKARGLDADAISSREDWMAGGLDGGSP